MTHLLGSIFKRWLRRGQDDHHSTKLRTYGFIELAMDEAGTQLPAMPRPMTWVI